jgi:hypothetical protein
MKKEIQERLAKIPELEKAKMMFLIKKKREKLANEVDYIYKEILKLNEKSIYKKSTTTLLKQVEKFLENDSQYIFAKFSNAEYDFSKRINYLNKQELSSIKKYLPFIQSQSEITNRKIITTIYNLFEKKKEIIKSNFKSDIEIVNNFIKYVIYKLKSKEVFYCIPDYDNISWTKKSFIKNLSNYFLYMLRLNPKSLDNQYIDNMKGYYSYIGLGIENKSKTDLANDYFITNKDSFNFGYNSIPEKYNEVLYQIKLVPAVMMKNENDLQLILDYAIEEYNR